MKFFHLTYDVFSGINIHFPAKFFQVPLTGTSFNN